MDPCALDFLFFLGFSCQASCLEHHSTCLGAPSFEYGVAMLRGEGSCHRLLENGACTGHRSAHASNAGAVCDERSKYSHGH